VSNFEPAYRFDITVRGGDLDIWYHADSIPDRGQIAEYFQYMDYIYDRYSVYTCVWVEEGV